MVLGGIPQKIIQIIRIFQEKIHQTIYSSWTYFGILH